MIRKSRKITALLVCAAMLIGNVNIRLLAAEIQYTEKELFIDSMDTYKKADWTLNPATLNNGSVVESITMPDTDNKVMNVQSLNGTRALIKRVLPLTEKQYMAVEAKIYPVLKAENDNAVHFKLTDSTPVNIANLTFSGDYIKYKELENGTETVKNICRYDVGQWYKVRLLLDFTIKKYDIYINDVKYVTGVTFLDSSANDIRLLYGEFPKNITGQFYLDDIRILELTPDIVYEDSDFDSIRLKWRELLLTRNQSVGPYEYAPFKDGGITSIPQTEPCGPALEDGQASYTDAYVKYITDMVSEYYETMDKSADRKYIWSDAAFNGRNSTPIYVTYSRLNFMALAYSMEGSLLKGNKELFKAITDALDWMYTNHYNENITEEEQYNNWWHWQIGVPHNLANTICLLYDELTAMQRNNYINAINNCTPSVSGTGANRAWTANVVMMMGILGKNGTKIAEARDGYDKLFNYVTKLDGFYEDGS